jgi:hypothetical protein
VTYESSASITAEIKVLLAGAYDSNGHMRTDLLAANQIPTAHPYNTPPWDYTGTESVGSVPANIVDWVLVSLRTSFNDPAVATVAAFLYENGDIVGLDGSSPVTFPGVAPDDYYVVVDHRNHLPITAMIGGALAKLTLILAPAVMILLLEPDKPMAATSIRWMLNSVCTVATQMPTDRLFI